MHEQLAFLSGLAIVKSTGTNSQQRRLVETNWISRVRPLQHTVSIIKLLAASAAPPHVDNQTNLRRNIPGVMVSHRSEGAGRYIRGTGFRPSASLPSPLFSPHLLAHVFRSFSFALTASRVKRRVACYSRRKIMGIEAICRTGWMWEYVTRGRRRS